MGLTPMKLGWVSCASRHWKARSGHIVSPSIITIDARTSSAETSAFHIIHAVVENHSRRPPGLRSQHSPTPFGCSISWPPWPCTMALGSPVVPDEKRT